jgi:hypothetical protein
MQTKLGMYELRNMNHIGVSWGSKKNSLQIDPYANPGKFARLHDRAIQNKQINTC